MDSLFLIFTGAILFSVFFLIQKTVFIYAQSMITKFMPVLILFLLLIFGYIAYRIEMKSLFERGAITMAIDSTEMVYTLGGIVILIALAGCIFGIVFAGAAEILKNKIINNKGEN